MKAMSLWVSALVIQLGLVLTVSAQQDLSSPIRELPVLNGGRVKPYGVFARETLELLYGKSQFEGKPAHELVTTMWLQPDLWQKQEFIEIKHFGLKQALGLSKEVKYVSLDFLFKHSRLTDLFQELQVKRDQKLKLDPFGQAVQRLESQLVTYRELAAGRLLKLLPISASEDWLSIDQFNDDQTKELLKVTQAFVDTLGAQAGVEKKDLLHQQVQQFIQTQGISSEILGKVKWELHYQDLHPFRVAWIAYALGLLVATLIWIFKKNQWSWLMWAAVISGLVFHLYGFALRSYLSGRAPVTNMYETVVWVGFGAVLFAVILELVYRWRLVLVGGTAVGLFCLILSDLAPVVLDPSIQPLEPVLRSNFWLTIHVLTITISYAAFFLAFALGDIGLFFILKNEERYQDRIKAIVLASYRAMQIGIGLIAPGIILGGIWADYSWGRFWGWDPKETWSLIALLGYLAVLHARLAGYLKNFGMLVAAILTFSLVVMSWYGVNFVLGAGLHTYGFGAGGVEYVAGFIGLHLIYVIYAVVFRWQKKRS